MRDISVDTPSSEFNSERIPCAWRASVLFKTMGRKFSVAELLRNSSLIGFTTMLEKLVATKDDKSTYETLKIVHDTMIEELSKNSKDYIWPNVDFWSGSL